MSEHRNWEGNLRKLVAADAPSELAPASGTVFEVVDTTSEESYYTMGIWPTLEAAVERLRALGPDMPGEHDDDCCIVEIRERKLGVLDWSETGKVRWTFKWEKIYPDEGDKFWRVSDTPNTTAKPSPPIKG